ncbi:MAG TPA: hypothetical protein VK689_23120 [Armatimonadota bacterium]|nr:hypothetical protein [Armatimonadota bacterium]
MSFVIELHPETERQLRDEARRHGQDPVAFARVVLEERLATAQQQRNQSAIALVEQWLEEPPTEEDERWPELEAALEANREGQRRLFSG